MGNQLIQLVKPKKVKILVLGPDSAGKTTMLYRLKTGRNINTIPTIGFNTEEIEMKGHKMIFWDVGGQDKIRDQWKYYFYGVGILAFIIDSSDHERLFEAKELLLSVLKDQEMSEVIVVVFANKQDVERALSPGEVAKNLELANICHQKWFVQPCCATTGDGLYEGLNWALQEAKKKKKSKSRRRSKSTFKLKNMSASI